MKDSRFKSLVLELVEYCLELLERFFPSNEQEDKETLTPTLIGTWIAKGNTYANRWIFRSEGIVEKYYKNELYKTYYWDVKESHSASGGMLRELRLANVNNPGTDIDFHISVLTSEKLILVYDMGIEESERVFDRY